MPPRDNGSITPGERIARLEEEVNGWTETSQINNRKVWKEFDEVKKDSRDRQDRIYEKIAETKEELKGEIVEAKQEATEKVNELKVAMAKLSTKVALIVAVITVVAGEVLRRFF